MKGLNFELRFYALQSLSVQNMSRVSKINYFYNTGVLRLNETSVFWNIFTNQNRLKSMGWFRIKHNSAGSKDNNVV